MKKCILFFAMLLALCFALTGCDSGSSGGGDDPAPSTYTVSFDMKGHGTQIDPITGVESGAMITKPANPTATGFNFVRWYKDADCTTAWDFDSDTVTEDITLHALWTDQPVCTISFDANGVSGSMTPVRVIKGENYTIPASTFVTPKIPTGAVNEGADILFKCWNDGSADKNVDEQITVNEDITLKAQWAKPSFSVSATKKVYFAKGNLQAAIDAAGAPTTWKFATNQYDYLGEGGSNLKIGSAAGDMDLFGWATDGDGADSSYKPWGILNAKEIEDMEHDTRSCPSCWGNFTDWGTNIGNGTTWSTLSKDEWYYLLKSRANASNLMKQKVTVCDKTNCFIIAPDDFTGTIAESYDATAWTEAEDAGLVCLPAAGNCYTYDSNIYYWNSGDYGFYWTSTKGEYDSANAAMRLNTKFNSSYDYYCEDGSRSLHFSVRLVCDAE